MNDDRRQQSPDFAARHFRWNFSVLLIDACGYFAGLTFFDSNTVVPVLLARLGAQDWLIGLSRLIQTLGFTLPALIAAHYIHDRPNHKSFLLVCAIFARLGIFCLPPLLLVYGATRPDVVLAGFVAAYAVFWLMDGACAVSWFDIVAKCIPIRWRGRFFGVMQMGNGLLAMGAGYIVSVVLRPGGFPFPANFALLAAFWCAGGVVSQGALFLIREPDGAIAQIASARPSLAEYLRRVVPLLKENPRIRRLLVTRLLLDASGLASPFYVLFAQRDLHVSLRMVGIYAVCQSLGKVCTGPLWGWITDHRSPATGLRSVAVAVALAPMAAVLAAHGPAWVMFAVFFLVGAVQDGVWIAANNVLLESVDEAKRPLAIGVASVCLTPSAGYGLIGGILTGVAGYPTVFGLTLVLTAAGVVGVFGLPARPTLQSQIPNAQ